MGQEITHKHFNKSDFESYRNKLNEELDLVKNWFAEKNINPSEPPLYQSAVTIGFELEICLVDQQGQPVSINHTFLSALQDTSIATQVSLELAQFNIELNSLVFTLNTFALQELEKELTRLWSACEQAAEQLNCKLLMIGSLPSLQEKHLRLNNMSPMTRYAALNEQVLRSRKGRAIELDIQGSETLKSIHQDVMLESIATSFQLHLQMPFARSVRYYNAAIILSAPIVAVTANSPFIFGKNLWCESRIPVFEQAVSVGGFDGAAFGPIKRVSFGSGYARNSLLECFAENNEHFPILLPEVFSSAAGELAHLNLHNGTIWRWNRPLLEPDKEDWHKDGSNKTAKRHYNVRLEHRVIPAGPTIVDSIANAAFFYGAVTAMANQYIIPESKLDFVQAKENFYSAARQGLKAKMNWLSAQNLPVKALILDYILPMAKDGLSQAGIARADIDYYLGIIELRTKKGQNGAIWQRRYVEKYGKDMQALTLAYEKNQQSGLPVHQWKI